MPSNISLNKFFLPAAYIFTYLCIVNQKLNTMKINTMEDLQKILDENGFDIEHVDNFFQAMTDILNLAIDKMTETDPQPFRTLEHFMSVRSAIWDSGEYVENYCN